MIKLTDITVAAVTLGASALLIKDKVLMVASSGLVQGNIAGKIVQGLGLQGMYGFGVTATQVVTGLGLLGGFIIAPLVGTAIGNCIKNKRVGG